MKKPKKYRVYIKETTYWHIDVDATSKKDAKKVADEELCEGWEGVTMTGNESLIQGADRL